MLWTYVVHLGDGYLIDIFELSNLWIVHLITAYLDTSARWISINIIDDFLHNKKFTHFHVKLNRSHHMRTIYEANVTVSYASRPLASIFYEQFLP